MITVLDLQTGETTERELTDAEAEALIPSQEAIDSQRVQELRLLLINSDYVALSDYDQENPELVAQRKEWRDEIRSLNV
tara:strand:- start:6193 stop:6429 length:237 start_codon:yes stop_codon:yes gene_type:complete